MSARLTITLSYTPVWLLFLACLFAIPAHADRYDGAGDRGFHWRDILRDAAQDTMIRQYRAPDRRSDEQGYRGDDPQDRYYHWRERREAEWRQREEAADRAKQELEAERARREEEQRRQETAERERQVLLEQQQREEAAAREREELARQRLIAQQQGEQRAAEQARLERERQQQAQASQSRDEIDPQFVTTFSPWRAVANPTFVFFHPEKCGYGDPLVYHGKREEMVFATIHRKYHRPGLSVTLYEVDFDSQGGEHVSGWMYSEYVSSFSTLERPWPAEFVVPGSIVSQPTSDINVGLSLYYGVQPGTQVEAIGYANTDHGTWYLVTNPNSNRISGWVQAGQIQEKGTLARMAEQRAAEQRRAAMERQQTEALLRDLPSQAFAVYLAFGFLLALIPHYRHSCEERVNTAGGIVAFVSGRILSLLAFSGFVAMVFMGIGSAGAGILALVLLAVGIRTGAYVPWLIFAVFEYLHYLFVPHPIESPIDKAMTEHDPSKVRLGEVTDAMFDYERDDLPPKWQSENYARRLDALEKRIRGEKAAVDGLSEYLRKKSGEQTR